MEIDELVYDWNTIEPSLTAPDRHISIDDINEGNFGGTWSFTGGFGHRGP